ncbi:MAG: hypothetical protein VX438_14680, partial [Planctomycetota bacterium]|nr:hypothetical protein [Planctomycetota bacterium]
LSVLDLAQLALRTDLEGTSLKPLLENPKSPWNRPSICTFGPNNHSLRGNQYRYTRYADGSEELYNHRDDPNEWKNLLTGQNASNEAHQVANRMRRWLPNHNADPILGSAGSDSPLYGEGNISLGEAMKRGEARRKKK